MARPTGRVLALLEILQQGGWKTVSDLATRVGVDQRTLRRYAAHLTDIGIPVESRRGRYGGYRLAPGYKLPPLMLTEDETVATDDHNHRDTDDHPDDRPSPATKSSGHRQGGPHDRQNSAPTRGRE